MIENVEKVIQFVQIQIAIVIGIKGTKDGAMKEFLFPVGRLQKVEQIGQFVHGGRPMTWRYGCRRCCGIVGVAIVMARFQLFGQLKGHPRSNITTRGFG